MCSVSVWKRIGNFFRQKWIIFFLSTLFIIGFLLRLFLIFNNNIDNLDQLAYIEIAEFMFGVEGKSYVAPREPLFPFLLGFIFLIFPNSFFTARVFTAVLGSINIVIVFFVAKKYATKFGIVNNNEKFGIVASLLVCFNDRLINYDGWALRESLFTLLFLLLFYSILIEKKILKRLAFSIISFLLILTKSESLLLLIGLSILIYYNENIRKTSKSFSDSTHLKEVIKDDEKEVAIVDEKVAIEPSRIEESEKNSDETRKNRLAIHFKKVNYNFTFILIGLIIGFCLWKLLSHLIFSNPFATSDWLAEMYFFKEFNLAPPENLSTFDYLFNYHSFKELAIAFYQGITGMLNRYLGIFNLLSFPFFMLTILGYFFKKDYLSLYWVIYPIIFLGIFAMLWGMDPYDRILLPYSMIGFVTMPIVMYKLLEDFELTILRKIKISKEIAFYILTLVIVIYSMGQLYATFF